MQRLVNEFRDYARLPAAQLQRLDLNQLIGQVLLLYETEAGTTPCAVQFEPDRACPPILGDAQQLRQVIHNLVQNALDAGEAREGDGPASAPPAGPILVRTQWLEQAGRVRMSVLDHGGGFSEAVLKRAFEPYITTKAKGTGLGLAVVQKIAQEHAARLDLANRVADGQVFGAQVSLTFDPAPVAGPA